MDTDLSDHSGFESLRADHPNCTVPALPVVVQLNIFEHLSSHGLPRLESFAMDGLDLEAVEKAFSARVDAPISVKSRIQLLWGHTVGDDKPHE